MFSPFYDTFLVWRIDVMVMQSQESASLWTPWTPCTATSWNRVLPYLFTRFNIKRSVTNIFLSLDMLIWRISRLSFSMAIHNQIYSEPTLIIVSLIINPVIRSFLELNISGLYFWIQSLMAVWLHLTNLDTALEVFLNERPRK